MDNCGSHDIAMLLDYSYANNLWYVHSLDHLWFVYTLAVHKNLFMELCKLQGIVYRREGSIRDYRSETVLH